MRYVASGARPTKYADTRMLMRARDWLMSRRSTTSFLGWVALK